MDQSPVAGDPVPTLAPAATAPSNLLLSVLEPAALAALLARAEPIRRERGGHVVLPGDEAAAWFPEVGVIGLQVVAPDGEDLTIAAIGAEGVAGLWAYLGGTPSPYAGVALVALTALRVPRDSLLAAVSLSRRLGPLLGSYAQLQLNERAILMHCNRSHHLDARVARWLLAVTRAARTRHLTLTHDDVARGVGAYRPAVTDSLHRMAASGAIEPLRGLVEILDPEGLRTHACECHETIGDLYATFGAEVEDARASG